MNNTPNPPSLNMGRGPVLLLAFFLLAAAGCAARSGPFVTETALRRYDPIKIASGVPAGPGSLSWSTEGASLAFVGKKLTIYDTISREQTSFPIENPYYVVWGPDGLVYTLLRDKAGNTILCSLDRKSSRINSVKLDHDTDALYPSPDGKNLILVSAGIRRLSFGTVISDRVVLRDMTTGRTTTVYNTAKTYIMKNPNIAALKAWTHAGPSPLDSAVLVLEHVVPPDVPSYTKGYVLDLASGEISEMSNPDARKIYLSASWSPDGKRAAMTDGDGRFEVRDRFGKGVVLNSPHAGLFPSWNPRGSRIYFGGYLIDSDGKNEEALLINAGASIAQWSPDGTSLAVATGDGVMLFQNMRASYIPPDGPLDEVLAGKLALLKDLLAAGVLTAREYQEKRDRLMMSPGGVK